MSFMDSPINVEVVVQKFERVNRAEEVKLPRKADYYKTLHGVVTNLRTNKIPIMH